VPALFCRQGVLIKGGHPRPPGAVRSSSRHTVTGGSPWASNVPGRVHAFVIHPRILLHDRRFGVTSRAQRGSLHRNGDQARVSPPGGETGHGNTRPHPGRVPNVPIPPPQTTSRRSYTAAPGDLTLPGNHGPGRHVSRHHTRSIPNNTERPNHGNAQPRPITPSRLSSKSLISQGHAKITECTSLLR